MTRIVADKDNSLCNELQRYEDSTWWSTEEELIKQHGPLLFFKQNEKVKYKLNYTNLIQKKDFPILSSLAKAIFCLFPASTSIESKFSTTDLIMTDRRSRMKPQLFEDLSIVKFNY